MASTGMRVGGLVEIRLKHLQKKIIEGDVDSRYVYKIIVYGSSSKHRYTTYRSPEAAKDIDEYLEMRRRYGENLVQDRETGRGLKILVFRKQFGIICSRSSRCLILLGKYILL